MKKITLLAAFAALAVSASAQYTTTTPYANESVKEGSTSVFQLVVAAEEVFTSLKAAGQTTVDWRVNDDTRWLYLWDQTLTGGDGSYPGVGYSADQYDGYPALKVTNIGWSGGGFYFGVKDGNTVTGGGEDTSNWTDETRFHVALMSTSVAPASLALIIAEGDPTGSAPGKIAVGANFEDQGAVYPTIGPALNDDWQGYDISFADIKKLWKGFNYVPTKNWTGNIVSFLAGGVEGTEFSMDCMYFYTPGEGSGVGSVATDAQFVVTRNTVNVAGGEGIQLYDLSGRMLKSVNGTTMGINELGNGIYVVKSGNSVQKIVK